MRKQEKEQGVRAPSVIAYPPSNPQDGKTTLLCVASGMVPDAIRFKWTEGGKEVPEAGKNIRELKTEGEGGYTTSMLIIDQSTTHDKKYTCLANHEATQDTPIKADIPKGKERKKNEVVPTPCAPPDNDFPDLIFQEKLRALRASSSRIAQECFDLTRSLYLAILTYTLMILKSVTYFGVASFLMHKRSIRSSANGPVTRR